MALTVDGPVRVSGSRTAEGHREYKVTTRLRSNTRLDGPATVLSSGLIYSPGDAYVFDYDAPDFAAFCLPTAQVKSYGAKGDEKVTFWEVEQTFTTNPRAGGTQAAQRCNDTEVDNPLLEPTKVSGGFNKFTEEAVTDRFGRFITNSAHEQIRGAQVEFDSNRATVRVEQNIIDIQLSVLSTMIDAVNEYPMWGFPARCIKLSGASWEELYYGRCFRYYRRSLEFEVNRRTWDRDILDEGTKVLNGKWAAVAGTGSGSGSETGWVLVDIDGGAPDPTNPNHFIRFKDRTGENARVVLNGAGLPAEVMTAGTAYYIRIGSGTTLDVPVTTTAFWAPVKYPVLFDRWQDDFGYVKGETASFNGAVYVSLSDENGGYEPAEYDGIYWASLGAAPVNAGDYSDEVSYSPGNYVRNAGGTTSGTVRVEKYPGTNFFRLGGIPVFIAGGT